MVKNVPLFLFVVKDCGDRSGDILHFKDDFNTIFGVTFDHKGETPGLGAEINMDWFEEPFKGKQIFDEQGNFIRSVLLKVVRT